MRQQRDLHTRNVPLGAENVIHTSLTSGILTKTNESETPQRIESPIGMQTSGEDIKVQQERNKLRAEDQLNQLQASVLDRQTVFQNGQNLGQIRHQPLKFSQSVLMGNVPQSYHSELSYKYSLRNSNPQLKKSTKHWSNPPLSTKTADSANYTNPYASKYNANSSTIDPPISAEEQNKRISAQFEPFSSHNRNQTFTQSQRTIKKNFVDSGHHSLYNSHSRVNQSMQFSRFNEKSKYSDQNDNRPQFENEQHFDKYKGQKLRKKTKEVLISKKHSRSSVRIQDPLEPIDVFSQRNQGESAPQSIQESQMFAAMNSSVLQTQSSANLHKESFEQRNRSQNIDVLKNGISGEIRQAGAQGMQNHRCSHQLQRELNNSMSQGAQKFFVSMSNHNLVSSKGEIDPDNSVFVVPMATSDSQLNLNEEQYSDMLLPPVDKFPNSSSVTKYENQKMNAYIKSANSVRALKLEANRISSDLDKIKNDYEFDMEQEHHLTDEERIQLYTKHVHKLSKTIDKSIRLPALEQVSTKYARVVQQCFNLREDLLSKRLNSFSNRQQMYEQKLEKLQKDTREAIRSEKEMKELLERLQNQHVDSMKHIANSRIEEQLKEFFKEQKQYEEYNEKPDMEKVQAIGVLEMNGIVHRIELDSRIKADFETTEDMYHDDIYGKPKDANMDLSNYDETSSECDANNQKKDPFKRIAKKTVNQEAGTKELLTKMNQYLESIRAETVEAEVQTRHTGSLTKVETLETEESNDKTDNSQKEDAIVYPTNLKEAYVDLKQAIDVQQENLERQEKVNISQKSTIQESQATIEFQEESIKSYEEQMKQFRGFDMNKIRSIDSELKMLKSYQTRQTAEITQLYVDIEWYRKMSGEKSSELQLFKNQIQAVSDFYLSQMQQLLQGFSIMKKHLSKELIGFDDRDFIESQTFAFQCAKDKNDTFRLIKLGLAVGENEHQTPLQKIQAVFKDIMREVNTVVTEQLENSKSMGSFIHLKQTHSSEFIASSIKTIKDLVRQNGDERPVNIMLQKVYDEISQNIKTTLQKIQQQYEKFRIKSAEAQENEESDKEIEEQVSFIQLEAAARKFGKMTFKLPKRSEKPSITNTPNETHTSIAHAPALTPTPPPPPVAAPLPFTSSPDLKKLANLTRVEPAIKKQTQRTQSSKLETDESLQESSEEEEEVKRSPMKRKVEEQINTEKISLTYPKKSSKPRKTEQILSKKADQILKYSEKMEKNKSSLKRGESSPGMKSSNRGSASSRGPKEAYIQVPSNFECKSLKTEDPTLAKSISQPTGLFNSYTRRQKQALEDGGLVPGQDGGLMTGQMNVAESDRTNPTNSTQRMQPQFNLGASPLVAGGRIGNQANRTGRSQSSEERQNQDYGQPQPWTIGVSGELDLVEEFAREESDANFTNHTSMEQTQTLIQQQSQQYQQLLTTQDNVNNQVMLEKEGQRYDSSKQTVRMNESKPSSRKSNQKQPTISELIVPKEVSILKKKAAQEKIIAEQAIAEDMLGNPKQQYRKRKNVDKVAMQMQIHQEQGLHYMNEDLTDPDQSITKLIEEKWAKRGSQLSSPENRREFANVEVSHQPKKAESIEQTIPQGQPVKPKKKPQNEDGVIVQTMSPAHRRPYVAKMQEINRVQGNQDGPIVNENQQMTAQFYQGLPQGFTINEATGKIEEDYGDKGLGFAQLQQKEQEFYSATAGHMTKVKRAPDKKNVELSMQAMFSNLEQLTLQNEKFTIDPRYSFLSNQLRGMKKIARNQSNSPPKLWIDKKDKVDKAVQVYQDVLTEKFGWKKEVESKMVQTDDIDSEQLAMQLFQFKQSSHYHKYYQYTQHQPQPMPSPNQLKVNLDQNPYFAVQYNENEDVSRVLQDVYSTPVPTNSIINLPLAYGRQPVPIKGSNYESHSSQQYSQATRTPFEGKAKFDQSGPVNVVNLLSMDSILQNNDINQVISMNEPQQNHAMNEPPMLTTQIQGMNPVGHQQTVTLVEENKHLKSQYTQVRHEIGNIEVRKHEVKHGVKHEAKYETEAEKQRKLEEQKQRETEWEQARIEALRVQNEIRKQNALKQQQDRAEKLQQNAKKPDSPNHLGSNLHTGRTLTKKASTVSDENIN